MNNFLILILRKDLCDFAILNEFTATVIILISEAIRGQSVSHNQLPVNIASVNT